MLESLLSHNDNMLKNFDQRKARSFCRPGHLGRIDNQEVKKDLKLSRERKIFTSLLNKCFQQEFMDQYTREVPSASGISSLK